MGNYRSCKYVYKDQPHSASKQAFAIYLCIQTSKSRCLSFSLTFLPSSLQHLHLYISEGEREGERERSNY